jgi:hypothetical protein
MEGQGRSEGLVLQRTVRHMREQLELRRQLVREREARGEIVDEKLKEYVADISRTFPTISLTAKVDHSRSSTGLKSWTSRKHSTATGTRTITDLPVYYSYASILAINIVNSSCADISFCLSASAPSTLPRLLMSIVTVPLGTCLGPTVTIAP